MPNEERDHRDDAQPGQGIVYGLPAAIVMWLVGAGVGGGITWAVMAWMS